MENNNYDNEVFLLYKNLFRNIEKSAKKCVALKGAIKYNKTCLNNGIYPKYVKIKLRGRESLTTIMLRKYRNKNLLMKSITRQQN
jgi:hypothetical protein